MWDCVKNDMESLDLSQKDAQSRNKWRRIIKGQPANPGSPGKWPLERRVCVKVKGKLVKVCEVSISVSATCFNCSVLHLCSFCNRRYPNPLL